MMGKKTVLGCHAPPCKLTKLGAALLAMGIALPAGAALSLMEWLFF